MGLRKRRGFTLVELLVVVAIIAMLVALLLPAITRAREAAKRARCQNYLGELAKAVIIYETEFRSLPGYADKSGNNNAKVSWIGAVFTQLGRGDLAKNPDAGVRVDQLICPSDVRPGAAAISYVANCGKPGDNDTAADAVFLNVADNPQNRTTLDGIKDGTQSTIMLSENKQAGQYTEAVEFKVGINYGGVKAINEDKDFPSSDAAHARPSSNHSGGVNVAYCDGHVAFLSDETGEYQARMTPAGGEPLSDQP